MLVVHCQLCRKFDVFRDARISAEIVGEIDMCGVRLGEFFADALSDCHHIVVV
jgi:hypothetical protein